MNAASQVPSGVLISTSVSTISMPMSAAAVDVTVAAMPALIKRAAKSRRVMSPGCDWLLGWLFSSSVIVFRAKSLSHFASRLHPPRLQIITALGVARSLRFFGKGRVCAASHLSRDRAREAAVESGVRNAGSQRERGTYD